MKSLFEITSIPSIRIRNNVKPKSAIQSNLGVFTGPFRGQKRILSVHLKLNLDIFYLSLSSFKWLFRKLVTLARQRQFNLLLAKSKKRNPLGKRKLMAYKVYYVYYLNAF